MLWELIRSTLAQYMFLWRNKKNINNFCLQKAFYLVLCFFDGNFANLSKKSGIPGWQVGQFGAMFISWVIRSQTVRNETCDLNQICSCQGEKVLVAAMLDFLQDSVSATIYSSNGGIGDDATIISGPW